VLAQDCVPTVSALVSRQFDLDGAASLAGPLLVADFPSLRPRWSVSLPDKAEFGTRMPILRSAAPVSNEEGASKSVATHLAIALRSAGLSDDASASEGEQRASAAQEGPPINPMSIVADVGDADRAERLLQAIREAVGETDVELIVRLNGTDLALSEAIDRIWGSGNWKAASPDSDLRDLASAATHDHLLTVSDRVISIDSGALRSLGEILDDGAATASVSCTLFAETIIKKKAVAQPASAGLFPVGVSFVGAPNLAFGEPDVRQALPAMTYPVVANTLHFTMWRRAVLAKLPRPRGPVPNSAEDIRIGLDLLAAGHQNLCTSRLAVRLSGAYKRRDAIDPLGSAYLDPGRWEDVLGRVTLVRELF
jgi:hypothetical protein